MSEYGLKIKNFEAGSLYGYNLGIRDVLDSTDAMLTNSLFSDFLKENGLNIWKGVSTRDIICIEFNYGTRSYEEEMEHFAKNIKNIQKDEDLSNEEKIQAIQKIEFFKERAIKNKDKYQKKSRQELRTIHSRDDMRQVLRRAGGAFYDCRFGGGGAGYYRRGIRAFPHYGRIS